MSIYTSRLVSRECVAHETLTCVVKRPAGFTFRAGHYVDVTLPEHSFDDALGPTRSFSIASAPQEHDLLLLMRMRDSAFKRFLAAMPLGAPQRIDGPADDLALRLSDGRETVMLAGGVGIAPFLSALREADCNGSRVAATLFYSNRRTEDAAFLDEIPALAAHIPGFRFVPIMTRTAESSCAWTGETDRLAVPLLHRYLPALRGPQYYLSGSTLFISGVCQEIERAGVPGSDIRIEMYTGY